MSHNLIIDSKYLLHFTLVFGGSDFIYTKIPIRFRLIANKTHHMEVKYYDFIKVSQNTLKKCL